MITTINEFKQSIINEVRLPHGYFKVIDSFSLPDGEWDQMFNPGNIIEIDTVNKLVKNWAQLVNNTTMSKSGKWQPEPFPYNKLMQPEYYNLFKNNTQRLPAEETPSFAKKDKSKEEIQQFTTTVKRFNTKALELGLEDVDKVKVTIL